MLTPEENEMLTRTGPNTPMGDLFRRFWIPALLAEELPGPDCPPVRVQIMGEILVAFRDTSDRIGLLEGRCPHRGADLSMGINTEGGLRCLLCGWKFDVEGNCLEIPLEPDQSGLRSSIHVPSYPVQQRGGILWAYLGPTREEPDFPQWEWTRVPDDHRYVSKCLLECNYMQAVEGGMDAARVASLPSILNPDHPRSSDEVSGSWRSDGEGADQGEATSVTARSAEYGLLMGARTAAGLESYRWRITQWLMPFYVTMPAEAEDSMGWLAWVPQDDESTKVFAVTYHPSRLLTPEELDDCRQGGGIHPEVIPGTYQRKRNKASGYRTEDEPENSAPMTGMRSLLERAMAIQESMGLIVDRSQENLGPNDVAIISARHLLLRAAIEIREGIEPAVARHGDAYRVRPFSTVLNREVAFDEDEEVRVALEAQL